MNSVDVCTTDFPYTLRLSALLIRHTVSQLLRVNTVDVCTTDCRYTPRLSAHIPVRGLTLWLRNSPSQGLRRLRMRLESRLEND